MLGQTYMQQQVKGDVSSTKRRTVHLQEDVFALLSKYVAKYGGTKESTVSDAVMDLVGEQRFKFLKMYAPHLSLEHSTPNVLYIADSELNKTAVIKTKWNNLSHPENNNKRPILSVFCELCESDNCIHVRYALVLPDILRIRKEGKLV